MVKINVSVGLGQPPLDSCLSNADTKPWPRWIVVVQNLRGFVWLAEVVSSVFFVACTIHIQLAHLVV